MGRCTANQSWAGVTEPCVPLHVDEGDPRGDALVASGYDLNPLGRRMWQRLCRREAWDIVVDVGANYGEMILTFPLPIGARTWAFEPAPRIAACLRQSVAETGAAVEVVELAVGSVSATTTLYEDPSWSGTTTTTRARVSSGHEPRMVGSMRLDEFLLDHGFRPGDNLLVKVDVEGGELGVLRSLVPVLPLAGVVLMQVEIAHTPDHDLEWMIGHFFLHVIDENSFIAVPVATLADLGRLLGGGRVYRQDAVLSTRVLEGAL